MLEAFIRFFQFLLVLGFGLVNACSKPAEDVSFVKSPDQSDFSHWLENHFETNLFASLSVIVLQDGEIVVESYLGSQDDEFDLPTSERTAYYIASVTKPISGVALFMADQRGEFELDQPVLNSPSWSDSFCNWFPKSSIVFSGAVLDDLTIPDFSCEGLTFRDVMNMQSNGKSGTGFIYNPVAYTNLSRAYEDITKKSFRELLHNSIFVPANMTDTAAGWRDRKASHVLSDLAPPFTKTDGKFRKQPFPDDDLRASAGLYANALDLAKFDRALDENKFMSAADKELMWTPPLNLDGAPTVYTNGWYTQNWKDQRLIWHGGWQPDAYSAIYLKVPEKNVTLIALANTEGLHWGNPLNDAQIEKSELVTKFLETFVLEGND